MASREVANGGDARGGGGGGGGEVIWSSFTNWIPVYGSLEESISVETSDEDASPPPPASSGLLLRKPPDDDESSPCEVTVCFSVKHEIHRVYVRSSARVYEIYYAADKENNRKTYLCTVCCGRVIKEEVLPSYGEVSTAEGENCTHGTMEMHEHMARPDNNDIDEEGWVDLKIPDSPSSNNSANSLLRKVDGTISSNFQMHHEATAEIADASPCTSLTVRLLSLETKTSVHIKEIYLYADPIHSTNPNPPATTKGSIGESSLLAMLVPNLMQTSKCRTSRIDDNYFSELRVQNSQYCLANTTNLCSSFAATTRPEQAHSGTNRSSLQEEGGINPAIFRLQSNQKVTDQEANSSTSDHCFDPMREETKVNPNYIQLGFREKLKDLGKASNSVIQANDIAQNRLEKVLNDLINKVDEIEAFCSRLEENIMKPLSCIETRLQRLEQKFDSFTAEIHHFKRNPSLQISAPEFPFYKSCFQNNVCDSCIGREDDALHNPSVFGDDVSASLPGSKIFPKLVDKVPDIVGEDSCGSPLQGNDVPDIVSEPQRILGLAVKAPVLPDGHDCLAASLEECNSCPCLVFKAPPTCNEDYKYANLVLNMDSGAADDSRYISPSSIDDGLASALEAFDSPNKVKSSKVTPSREISNKIFDANIYELGSSFLPEGANNLAGRAYYDQCIYGISDEMKKEATFGTLMLYADVETDPDPSLDESDLANKGCDESNVSEEGAAFDSSSSADYQNSILSPAPMCSGFIVSVPEFPKADDFIDYSDDSDSDMPFCLKDEESMAFNTRPVSALATFLTTKNVDNSNHSLTLPEPFSGAKIEPSAHGHPCKGISRFDAELDGNSRTGKVESSSISKFLLHNGRSEHDEHKKRSMEATAAASAECTNIEHVFNQIEAIAAKRQLLIQCLLNSTYTQNISLDDSDIEETESPRLPLSRGWTEESSMRSSLKENSIESEVQIYWLSDSSQDSLMGAPTQADDVDGKVQPSAETTMHQYDSTTDIGLLSTDCGVERSELQDFNSMFTYGNSIVDVNDTEAQKGSDCPLELLAPVVSARPSLRNSSSNMHQNLMDMDVLPVE